MNCPFCHCANAATSRACRVCGGPLRANQPKIAPRPVASTPVKWAQKNFADAASLIAADFAPDENSRVGLIRQNGVVQLWNIESDEISSFAVARKSGQSNPICCALVAENFVATGHQNGCVRWHDLDGHELKSPAPHLGRVLELASNATHLYSGGSDGVICATALHNNRKAKSCALIEGLGALTTFAVSPDANLIAIGCDDGAIELWRVNEERTAAHLDWTRREHGAPICSLAFSPNANMIISRDKAHRVGLWAAQTSYQLPLAVGARCSHIAPVFSSDNCWLAVASAHNNVEIFEIATERLLHKSSESGEKITHLAFAPDATWLLVAREREIAIWKII